MMVHWADKRICLIGFQSIQYPYKLIHSYSIHLSWRNRNKGLPHPYRLSMSKGGLTASPSHFLYVCCHLFLIWCFVIDFRHVFARFPRFNTLNVHLIDFLQCRSLSLQEEKVHRNGCSCAAAGKDVSVSEVNGRSDKGGEEGEEEIPGPVRRGRQCHALCSIAGGI